MRHRAGTVAALAAAAWLAATGAVVAQDAEAGPTDPAAGTAADDPSADLWLLNGEGIVTRLDGTTGQVVTQLDAATEDCSWERSMGVIDGAVWLRDNGSQGYLNQATNEGLAAGRFCFGRFPIDGSDPAIYSVNLGDNVSIDSAAVWDDAIWFVTGSRQVSDLIRLDISGDPANAPMERAAKGVDGVAVLGDQLVIVSDPKNKGRGKPATLVAAGGKPAKLDVGLKGKETVQEVAVGDGLLALSARDWLFVFDPTTGQLARIKDDSDLSRTVITKEGVWATDRVGPGLDLVRLDGNGRPEPVAAASGVGHLVVGSTPGAVWWVAYNRPNIDNQLLTGEITQEEAELLPQWVLQRVDTQTLQPTVEVDATEIRPPLDR